MIVPNLNIYRDYTHSRKTALKQQGAQIMAGLLITSVSSKAARGLKMELMGTIVSRIVIVRF
jgi:hypothetical protein